MPTWLANHSELAPDGEKLTDILNLAEYPVKMDTRLHFKVVILSKEVFELVDSLNVSVAKEAGVKLAQDFPSGSLNTDIQALMVSWENIQKIKISVGLDEYRPYMNDLMLAKPVAPKFAEDSEKSKKLMDKIFNDILIDIKMANRFVKKRNIESAEKLLSCVLGDAELGQVSELV